jgi:hypothetical protein
MEQGKIVPRLFVPAYSNTPKAVHPRVGPLHHPTSGLLARFSFDRLGLLATRPHMGREATFLQGLADVLLIVAFVQAQTLRLLRCWCRTLDHEAVERCPHPLHLMPVGAIDGQPKRHAAAVGPQATRDPAVGAGGWRRAGVLPLQAAPWSSPPPCAASPHPCPVARHTVPPPPARVCRRPPLRPMSETGRGRWIGHTTRLGAGLPIGSPCGARHKGPRPSGGPAHAGGPPKAVGMLACGEQTVPRLTLLVKSP